MSGRVEEERRRDEVNRLLAEVTLLRMRGQSQRALERCHEVLALDPASSFALEAQGDVLSDLGDHEAALKSYQEALRVSPGRGEVEEKVGLAALRLSDREDLTHIEQELTTAAEAQRAKRKTVPTAVAWSVFLPGGGYIYLGDHPRGAVVFLAFAAVALYLTGILLEAVAKSSSLESGLFGGIWIALRHASYTTRVGFSMAVAALVAVYLFNILDTLKKARGILLLPVLPQTPSQRPPAGLPPG